MGRAVRNSRGKTMKPNFFVFCEGKTEINYVKFLRSVFRVPIQVIAKKATRTSPWISLSVRNAVLF